MCSIMGAIIIGIIKSIASSSNLGVVRIGTANHDATFTPLKSTIP